MEALVSAVIANLYMQSFEQQAIAVFTHCTVVLLKSSETLAVKATRKIRG